MAQVSKTPVSDFDAAVRLLSGGTNVALYNDLGLPGIYVIKPKGNLSDVITTESMGVHPAFRVDGHEIDAFYMGKYLAAVYMGRALSLPLQDPSAYQVDASDKGDAPNTNVNFDNAKLWCEANGPGFHLPTIAEYAWIALLARKNETMPHGNTNYGASSDAAFEKGIGSTYGSDGRVNRTLTGSGPVSWNDNGKPDGISDICGNVWEWQGGYRIVEGELQFFADNDAAMQWQQNAESSLWKAMLPDGTLVAPGTAGTLKWDYTADPGTESAAKAFRLNTTIQFKQTVEAPYGGQTMQTLTAAPGVNIPERLIALGIMPESGKTNYGGDWAYMRNMGERLGIRGGHWHRGAHAGVFGLDGSNPRSSVSTSVGFRPAFIPTP